MANCQRRCWLDRFEKKTNGKKKKYCGTIVQRNGIRREFQWLPRLNLFGGGSI